DHVFHFHHLLPPQRTRGAPVFARRPHERRGDRGDYEIEWISIMTHPPARWAASRASALLLARTTKVVDSPVARFWAVIRYLLISFSCPSIREASVLVYRAWGYIA